MLRTCDTAPGRAISTEPKAHSYVLPDVSHTTMSDCSDVFYLTELINALDRRLPQPERPDAADIARVGADLRVRAIRRLSEIEDRRVQRSRV